MPVFFDWVDCSVDSSQFVMYLAGADDGVALKFFWNGHYEPFSLRIWAAAAAYSQKIKIDVGAHTGAYTLAAMARGAVNVVSFEPHFANFSRLMVNLKGNRFPVTNAHMLAVGDQDGWSTFNLPTRLDYLSTGGSLVAKGGGIKFPVQTVRLDRFIGEAHHKDVFAMKVDVEGLEIQVLRGAENILNKSRPYIFFECIDDSFGTAVQCFLEDQGYHFFLIDDEQSRLLKVDNIRAERLPSGLLNMSRLNRLAVPKGSDLVALSDFFER
jgi:FkbM family methyltransferase